VLADLAAWNAPPEVIAAAEAHARRALDFELFEDCAQALEVFQRMATQWRTRGMDGALQGLDYNTFPFVMQMCQVPRRARPQVFEDVQVMEMETLKVIRERDK
jgi:hypothetical protein